MKIVAGTPRSGTSLALSLYHWIELGEKLQVSSPCNEPQALTTNIALKEEPQFFENLKKLSDEFPVIKSPIIAAMLPRMEPEHEVILTFRDIRFVLPSIYRHHNGLQTVVCQEKPFWIRYCSDPVPENPFDRVLKFWEFLYMSAAEYKGDLSILNYGFWMEWPQIGGCRWKITGELNKEMSPVVITGMKNGLPYSNSSFDICSWNLFCNTYNLSIGQIAKATEVNERVRRRFAERGLTCKTWEDFMEERVSNEELVDLVGKSIQTAVSCDRLDMLHRMCKKVESLDGSVAEVGVWRGGTSNMMAKVLPGKQIFSFDSFVGLHNVDFEKGDEMKNGTFSDVSLGEVRAMLEERGNVKLYEGYFPETAEPVINEKFCLVHCDVDTHKSTKDVLEFFWPRLVSGGVIVIDDYGHPSTKGCRLAVDEFCAREVKAIKHFYGTIQCFLYKP